MSSPDTLQPRRLAALMGTAFVDTLGVFLVLALLPYYAEDFGATPTQVGALVAAFAFAQMIAAPLWGRLSDHWGRRPVILLGLAVSAVAYLVFAFAGSLTVLMLSRLAQGVGGGTVSVVFAYISESVPSSRRAEGIGWVTAATSGAAMIGPALGSFVGRLGPSYPGLSAAGFCVVGLAVAWVLLPEPVSASSPRGARPSLLLTVWKVLRRPSESHHLLIWIYALAMLATSAMTAVAGLYLDRRFGIGVDEVWVFFACLAGASLLTRVILLGPAVRRFGEATVLLLGALLFAAGLLGMPWPRSLAVLLGTVTMVAIGSSLLYPCTTALVSKHPGAQGELGLLLGVQQSFGGLSRIVGPLAAGVVFGSLGPGAPLLGAGALVLAVAALAWVGLGALREAEAV